MKNPNIFVIFVYMINRDINTREELIKVLYSLGFTNRENNNISDKDDFEYIENDKIIIQIFFIENDVSAIGSYLMFIGYVKVIDFLNEQFKHKLRKNVIENLLDNDDTK